MRSTHEDELRTRTLSAYYGKHLAVHGHVTMRFEPGAITALIGPSGCGKSTLLRCLNRMHEVIPNACVEGEVLSRWPESLRAGRRPHAIAPSHRHGVSTPEPVSDDDDQRERARRRPACRQCAAIGVARHEIAEHSLRCAALWDEVKDKLHQPGTSLSGGQQQRLCIARALAVDPEVLLMDEPASRSIPISTMKIEELMRELKATYTIVIVTHNMQQAARCSDYTGFMLAGENAPGQLVEFDVSSRMFTTPKDKRTEDYITGRFG